MSHVHVKIIFSFGIDSWNRCLSVHKRLQIRAQSRKLKSQWARNRFQEPSLELSSHTIQAGVPSKPYVLVDFIPQYGTIGWKNLQNLCWNILSNTNPPRLGIYRTPAASHSFYYWVMKKTRKFVLKCINFIWQNGSTGTRRYMLEQGTTINNQH